MPPETALHFLKNFLQGTHGQSFIDLDCRPEGGRRVGGKEADMLLFLSLGFVAQRKQLSHKYRIVRNTKKV